MGISNVDFTWRYTTPSVAEVAPNTKPKYHQLKNELLAFLSAWSAAKVCTQGFCPPWATDKMYSATKKTARRLCEGITETERVKRTMPYNMIYHIQSMNTKDIYKYSTRAMFSRFRYIINMLMLSNCKSDLRTHKSILHTYT